jgi:toxin ParE1/3/4
VGGASRSNARLRNTDLARKRYTVTATPKADADLVKIAAWYTERHPAGEDRFFREFNQARDMIARHPDIGRKRPELRAGLRSWPVHPYLIFYTVDDKACRATFVRVIHGHMDIDRDDFEP